MSMYKYTSSNVQYLCQWYIMEMEKLYGLEWKMEMCPDLSHLELWKWKIYMD